MPKTLVEQFKAAWRVGTPVIAIETPDPQATMALIQREMAIDVPIIKWNVVEGFQPMLRSKEGWKEAQSREANALGLAAISVACDGKNPAAVSCDPTNMLRLCQNLPEKTIVFAVNTQRFLIEQLPTVAQAICNLRDEFKSDNRALVMLGPSFSLPAELSRDVLLLEEPLPDEAQIKTIVERMYHLADVKPRDEHEVPKAVDALRGLAAFPAEQATAMCMSRQGLDLDGLWYRKQKMIEQTRGLSVWRGGETFNDIGGVDQAKLFFKQLIAGNDPPQVVVFLDEIEKMLAGVGGGDMSGISDDFHGVILSYMEDHDSDGSLFIGPPGAAKSLLAKGIGAEAGIPTIGMDLNGMKGSLVGESGASLRSAMKIITAVGRAFFVGTCNKLAVLPPELRRRFTSGIWYFDVPDAESNYQKRTERDSIWPIYLHRYQIDDAQLKGFDDTGWTGAEIKKCCRLAYRLKISLAEARSYIIPITKSAPDMVDELRRQADKKFLSASRPGVYEMASGLSLVAPKKERKLNV